MRNWLRSGCSRQYPLLRLALRVQTVDATPSNQLIQQYFPWRSCLFGCIGQNLVRAAFRCINLESDFGFCFQCKVGSSECCVDPLRPPR